MTNDQSTREIPLTQGKVALVDAADYDFLMQWKWCAHKRCGKWYACRNSRVSEGKRRLIHMHRVILQAEGGIEVDHRDGDGLNNSRSNLRIATPSQNQCNRKKQANNTGGYKGVMRRSNSWRAQISVGNVQKHLGTFATREEAAAAYVKAAKELHGDFANVE